jgi:hypothetical protein
VRHFRRPPARPVPGNPFDRLAANVHRPNKPDDRKFEKGT